MIPFGNALSRLIDFLNSKVYFASDKMNNMVQHGLATPAEELVREVEKVAAATSDGGEEESIKVSCDILV